MKEIQYSTSLALVQLTEFPYKPQKFVRVRNYYGNAALTNWKGACFLQASKSNTYDASIDNNYEVVAIVS